MIIAVLQMKPAPAAPDHNLSRIAQGARAAAAFGAGLLVTPEMSLTGYAIDKDIARLAEPSDGPMVMRLQQLVTEIRLPIVAGFPEQDGKDIYNSTVLARPDRGPVFYRKCHLYGEVEKAVFKASQTLPSVFEIGKLKAGLLICYDIEFPEMARCLALAGAELIIVPTALPAGPASRRISKSLVPTRALENHFFIAYAGLCGSERGFDYQGGSVITGPDGEDLARAGRCEALLLAHIDHDVHKAARAENPYLDDRRPDLYRSVPQR